MATVEFLQKRVAGKEKEIATLEKKLERIKKAEASNWENNPYWYSERDLVAVGNDIKSAEKALEDYKAKLAAEEEKNNSRNVQVILDFLSDWKARVFEFYNSGLEQYFSDYDMIRDLSKKLSALEVIDRDAADKVKLELDACRVEFREAKEGKFKPIPKDSPNYRRWYREKEKIATGKYEYLRDYFSYSSLDEATKALETTLQREANAKYDDIIERTNAIVGQITDASYLSIGGKGDLNGYIIGTKGKASVQTIGAGGYNIQCYHFRTLIREMK